MAPTHDVPPPAPTPERLLFRFQCPKGGPIEDIEAAPPKIAPRCACQRLMVQVGPHALPREHDHGQPGAAGDQPVLIRCRNVAEAEAVGRLIAAAYRFRARAAFGRPYTRALEEAAMALPDLPSVTLAPTSLETQLAASVEAVRAKR